MAHLAISWSRIENYVQTFTLGLQILIRRLQALLLAKSKKRNYFAINQHAGSVFQDELTSAVGNNGDELERRKFRASFGGN